MPMRANRHANGAGAETSATIQTVQASASLYLYSILLRFGCGSPLYSPPVSYSAARAEISREALNGACSGLTLPAIAQTGANRRLSFHKWLPATAKSTQTSQTTSLTSCSIIISSTFNQSCGLNSSAGATYGELAAMPLALPRMPARAPAAVEPLPMVTRCQQHV